MKHTSTPHDATRLSLRPRAYFTLEVLGKRPLARYIRTSSEIADPAVALCADAVTLKNINCTNCSIGVLLRASKTPPWWNATIRWGSIHGVQATNRIDTCSAGISSFSGGRYHLRWRRKQLSKGVGSDYGYIEQSTIHNAPRR